MFGGANRRYVLIKLLALALEIRDKYKKQCWVNCKEWLKKGLLDAKFILTKLLRRRAKQQGATV